MSRRRFMNPLSKSRSSLVRPASAVTATIRVRGAGTSGVHPLRLPLVRIVAIDPVFAILALFLFDTLLAFFALLAAVAHDRCCRLVRWRWAFTRLIEGLFYTFPKAPGEHFLHFFLTLTMFILIAVAPQARH